VSHRASPQRSGRSRGAGAPPRDAQNRTRIAQVAARLIAEHGIADWSLAKRKAARQLMLSDREPLPGDDEIEQALVEHHALFGGSEHAATLRAQREEALAWMTRLAAFRPTLIGGVAAGWASSHSDIRLELVADDAKDVELALINAGVAYRAVPARAASAATELHIETARSAVRLIVVSEPARWQKPRRRADGAAEPRLSASALAALLA
jgi:hypothetical protein